MNPDGPVIVIGAAGIDVKGRPAEPLRLGTSVTGVVRSGTGGVARNVAENLARLEIPTVLLSAVGQDHDGDYCWPGRRKQASIPATCCACRTCTPAATSPLLDPDGQLVYSVSEYDIVGAISPAYLQTHRRLLRTPRCWRLTPTCRRAHLAAVFRAARRYQLPVCADPTSHVLATKLIPYLPELHMVAPDAQEAAILCDDPQRANHQRGTRFRPRNAWSAGRQGGDRHAGRDGAGYSGRSASGHIPALNTQVTDRTGVGDALTAAVIFGLLNEMPTDEALRLGIAAAALTLRTRESVHPDLSLDLLYDQLIV